MIATMTPSHFKMRFNIDSYQLEKRILLGCNDRGDKFNNSAVSTKSVRVNDYFRQSRLLSQSTSLSQIVPRRLNGKRRIHQNFVHNFLHFANSASKASRSEPARLVHFEIISR